jgi:glutaconate CoA-transferase subunit B
MDKYNRQEMMAIAGARLLKDGEIVLVGTGLPLVSALIAKYTHAPDLIMTMEAGMYDSKPEALPFCVADPRGAYKNPWIGTAFELMAQLLQNQKIDVGFLGGAQVDRYGNLNSTCIGAYSKPDKRFEGSGGASDIAILAKKTIIIMAHERQRFVENVDFITSPGWMVSRYPDRLPVPREELDMWGGPYAVVSTMGVMRFSEDTHEMYLEGYFADLGVTPEAVAENTGFPIDVTKAVPIPTPTEEELLILRSKVDPEGIFMKY